jgi:hypothetical protein
MFCSTTKFTTCSLGNKYLTVSELRLHQFAAFCADTNAVIPLHTSITFIVSRIGNMSTEAETTGFLMGSAYVLRG